MCAGGDVPARLLRGGGCGALGLQCGLSGGEVTRIKKLAVVVSGTISAGQYVTGATLAVAIVAAVAAAVLLLGCCSAPTGECIYTVLY